MITLFDAAAAAAAAAAASIAAKQLLAVSSDENLVLSIFRCSFPVLQSLGIGESWAKNASQSTLPTRSSHKVLWSFEKPSSMLV
jgi:hypothetical protein